MSFIAIGLFIIILDQLTKIWAVSHLKVLGRIPLLGNFFQLVYVENRGVAFGLFSQLNSILPFFSLLLVVLLIYLAVKNRNKGKGILLALTFIIAGALGNIIDRFTRGYVVDFLSFHFFNYAFPVFNIADIFVTCGVILLLIFFIKEERSEDSKNKKERKEE